MSDFDEHYNRINHLLGSLGDARIYAGAEFEACCNEGNYDKAVYFSNIRDTLAAQINVLEDYRHCFIKTTEHKYAADRCPICGRKTSESANKGVGKICFACINYARRKGELGK